MPLWLGRDPNAPMARGRSAPRPVAAGLGASFFARREFPTGLGKLSFPSRADNRNIGRRATGCPFGNPLAEAPAGDGLPRSTEIHHYSRWIRRSERLFSLRGYSTILGEIV